VKAIALYSNDAEEQETQSPGEEWWQERFLKAAREIHEERLRNDQNSPKEAAEQAQALTCAGSSEYEVPPSPYIFPTLFPTAAPSEGGFFTRGGLWWVFPTVETKKKETQSPVEWWLERFREAAREIREQRAEPNALRSLATDISCPREPPVSP